MTDCARTLLQEMKDAISLLYRDRLSGVYLYGSYARGDFDEESDFDVLIVLDDFASYGAEVDRTSDLAAALSLKYDVSVSLVFARQRDWTSGASPFLADVREEAIAA